MSDKKHDDKPSSKDSPDPIVEGTTKAMEIVRDSASKTMDRIGHAVERAMEPSKRK